MQSMTPSINIFDEPTTEFSFRPQSTSMNAPDLLPLHNNPNQRFEQNKLLNGKTKYEEENTIIKSLEEEIVTMKHKMSFVYEKDEEIGKLKEQIRELTKQNTELDELSKEAVQLRLDNKRLTEALSSMEGSSKQVTEENQRLTATIQKLRQNDTIEDIGDSIEPVDEMMDINIPQLRHVLLTRLKDKQTEHIERLIEQYGLKRKNKVKRSLMEEMLEQAIHL